MPPLTVASLATTTQIVPSMRPMPVTMPAAGASSSYRPPAASGLSSRNARARVEQAIDALADGQLAALRCRAIDRSSPAGAAARDRRLARPQLGDQGVHRGAVRAALVGRGVEPAAQDGHARMIGGWTVAIVR